MCAEAKTGVGQTVAFATSLARIAPSLRAAHARRVLQAVGADCGMRSGEVIAEPVWLRDWRW